MKIKDGGPAFPGGELRFDEGDCKTPYNPGMSLRAWLAGQALASMGQWSPPVRNRSGFLVTTDLCDPRVFEARARWACAQADWIISVLSEAPGSAPDKGDAP